MSSEDPINPTPQEGLTRRSVPSVNRIFRIVFALVVIISIFVMAVTAFVAAKALHQWELETINAVLVGAIGPAKLAVEYLDATQAQNVTDGLLVSPGIYSASLYSDFGEALAQSRRPPPDTSWVVALLQRIWGETTLEITRDIEVVSGRMGELTVNVLLGATRDKLIQASILAILFQAGLVIILVSWSIYWAATLPLVSGLRTLSDWIRRTGLDETAPLPQAKYFRFSEILDSGVFLRRTIQDLIRQRRDLALTVGQLEEQVALNERYIGIIQEILSVTNKTALHISPDGQLTWYNRNEPVLGFLSEISADELDNDQQAFFARLRETHEVRRVTHKTAQPTGGQAPGRHLFDIDVELRDDRILQLIGIDLGESGLALMISDETQARSFAQDLFQKHKLESLGILASGIAHDMNNILAIVAGAVELELTRDPSPETERDMQLVLAAVSQGTSVVRTLLTFSRKTKAEVKVENAADILRDLQVILKGRIGAKVRTTTRIELDDAYVSVDRPRLTNALLNLAINAGDAVGHEGHIRLTLREATPDDELPSDRADWHDFIVFAVQDDGPGIPDDIRLRIMDPFFTTKPVDRGTGLGLTQAYNVVEEFDGKLSFRSEEHKGACFMIALPRCIENEKASGQRAALTQENAKEGRQSLLLVEDEAVLREIGQNFLEGKGYNVVAAASVAEAFAEIRSNDPFDIVITDLRLGDGTGADIAKVARSVAIDCTIVLMSGYMENGLSDEIADIVDAWLDKPFGWSELHQLLNGLSSARRNSPRPHQN